ncbi:MAG: c-type cytochrome biogenesis protein CcsB, partial [Thermocrinis sp.]|nr:c-type cytochrome biogenesis protein CcsB [Thermocrinis sp.]
MKEVSLKSGRSFALQGWLIPILGLLLSVILAFLPYDNVFWYKSATLAYGLSAISYLAFLFLRERIIGNVATGILFLGLLLNLTGMIRRGWQTYEMGAFHPPWSNLFEALTFWSFIAGVIYLLLERKYGVKLLGALITPIIFGLSLFAITKANTEITPLMPALRSYWLYIHVITAFVGYAGFTVA